MVRHMTAMGAAVALVGVVLTVLGLNWMKHVGDGESRPWRLGHRKAALWFLSFCAWGVGQLLQVVGLWLAPESVVATVANCATVLNALIASRLFGERFSILPPSGRGPCSCLCGWDLLSVIMLTGGACLVVVCAPVLHEASYTAAQVVRILLGRPFLVTLAITLAAGAGGSARIAADKGTPEGKTTPNDPALGLAYGAVAGVTGSLSFTATKLWLLLASAALGGSGSASAWRHPVAWVCLASSALTTFANMVALFAGMASQEALVVIPTYYIAQTVLTALQELALFSLYPELLAEPLEFAGFSAGIALCVWGVASSGQRPRSDAPEGRGLLRVNVFGPWRGLQEPLSTPHDGAVDQPRRAGGDITQA